MRWLHTTSGCVLAGVLTLLAWTFAYHGTISPRFEDDISIREESAGNGRTHGRGGLHGGK